MNNYNQYKTSNKTMTTRRDSKWEFANYKGVYGYMVEYLVGNMITQQERNKYFNTYWKIGSLEIGKQHYIENGINYTHLMVVFDYNMVFNDILLSKYESNYLIREQELLNKYRLKQCIFIERKKKIYIKNTKKLIMEISPNTHLNVDCLTRILDYVNIEF